MRNRLRTAESTTRIPTEEPVTAVSLCTAKSISFDPLGDAVLTHGFDEGSYIVDECVEPPDLYITRPPTFVHIDLDQEFRPPTMPRVSKHAWEVIYRNTSQTDLPRKPLLASVTLFLVARSPNE